MSEYFCFLDKTLLIISLGSPTRICENERIFESSNFKVMRPMQNKL